MTLAPGTELGRYEIRSKIGEGGMGEVYRAFDPKIGREVAIKVLPAELAANKERVARFEQEAQAAGALSHPNILAIYDVDTQGNILYVVSELLEGEELRDRLEQGPLSVRKAIEYAQQIVSGLCAAHEKGIVHRDLKPENLFITKDERVKILDFGIAKLTTSPQSTNAGSHLPRNDNRYGRLYVARAGSRGSGRSPLRYIQFRRDPLRNADGKQGISWRFGRRTDERDP